MTTAATVAAIDLYRQYISPHKGFSCAHRVRHGRRSCSQFAKRLVEKVGLMRFAPLLLRRLKRCGEAARAMQENRMRKSAVQAQRDADDRKRRSSRCDGCDPSPCDIGVPDVGGCDVPDCGGGCDLSV
jgi:putative component of membrane protein insertase Oxa1/YidC/SpoIIIJ protein YidD